MEDFFRIARGLYVDNQSFGILYGSGAPGNTDDTNSAPVGSIYSNVSVGAIYTKTNTAPGTASWSKQNLILYSENITTVDTYPTAQGSNSIALGIGATTDPAATNSLAIGDQSLARLYGGVVQASGRFQSTGDAQSGRYILRTSTINNSPAEMFLDGTNGSRRLELPDDSTWMYKIHIAGHGTDVTNGHAGYTVEGVIYRQSGANTVSMLGSPVKTVLAESNSQWDINITADQTHGSLKLTVIGQTSNTIRWVALVETVEITN